MNWKRGKCFENYVTRTIWKVKTKMRAAREERERDGSVCNVNKAEGRNVI